MDLIPNSTFRVLGRRKGSTTYAAGLYRVILDEPSMDLTVTVLIAPEDESRRAAGGRPKKETAHLKRPRKKPPQRLVGALVWMERSELQILEDARLLKPILVERRVAPEPSGSSKEINDRRVRSMAGFLDLKNLQESVLVHRGLGGLVAATMKQFGVSRAYVYKQWSSLCRWGFDELSLRVRFDRCGAPSVRRPCDPAGDQRPARRKAGRKTHGERIRRIFGLPIDHPTQPGMSSEWAAAIRAADKRIATPKPRWPKRFDQILKSAFCGKAREVDGRIEYVKPDQGTYPNLEQVKRVLTVDKTRLQRAIELTTGHHFEMACRGLIARNWIGVPGPGHTFAIDSTVGDIYLRSSLNRAWIVGRPIVYVIVDVWSTAIVGFYVCLSGPSWHTAKVSLFNAASDPALIADLWGYTLRPSLYPAPTLCYSLLCDRGEYLSKAHRSTARRFLPETSYTPPYRGDLKGLAEVIHRIEKDAQFAFIPGAMDYRRAELELRKVNPADCVFTVREYVEYLYELFTDYNVRADRSHRLDAHMLAAGVFPSPAGLWSYGHAVNVAFRRFIPESDLISELLPSATARVRRDCVRHAGCDYTSPEVQQAQWTTYARNFGGWNVPINYYPGAMGPLWTPNPGGTGLWRLQISDQSRASPELTMEEWSDALALETMRRAGVEHIRTMNSLDSLARITALRDTCIRRTKEAVAKASGPTPPMTEARAMEVAATSHPSRSETKVKEQVQDEAMETHLEMLNSLITAANYAEDHDA